MNSLIHLATSTICYYVSSYPNASVLIVIGVVVFMFISVIWQIDSLRGIPKNKPKGEFYRYGEED